jgi:hypothetical protein
VWGGSIQREQLILAYDIMHGWLSLDKTFSTRREKTIVTAKVLIPLTSPFYDAYSSLFDVYILVSEMACTCPHHVHRNAFCKHMAAVETATDVATLEAFPSEHDNDTGPEDCEGLSDFPCWPCVQTGRKELPN